MTTDLILKEKKCFDELNDSTYKKDECQDIITLEHIKQELNTVPNELRDTFIDELYQHIPHADLEGSEPSKKAKKVHPPKKLLFGWRRSAELLTLIMEELQDQVNIFADRSIVYTFVRILTSGDLSQEKERMYIDCKTNLFGYIVERLELYCISFNPTTIERSGLFVSKKRNRIRANNLYNTTKDNLRKKIMIDRILKKFL